MKRFSLFQGKRLEPIIRKFSTIIHSRTFMSSHRDPNDSNWTIYNHDSFARNKSQVTIDIVDNNADINTKVCMANKVIIS